MTLDGTFMVPKTIDVNRLTVGKHTTTVSLQDTAGQTSKYVNTFVVTTSFTDLATVIDQYANNALRTTLNGAQAVGATGLRLPSPVGFRAGQEIVVGTGDTAETVTIAKALSTPPTLNTTLSAAATAGATQVRLASYSTETPHGPEPAEQQRPDHRPADRARQRRQPGGRVRQAAHLAAAGRPGAERRAERAAGQGPRCRHGDEPQQRHPRLAADEGAGDGRGGRRPAAADHRRQGDRAAARCWPTPRPRPTRATPRRRSRRWRRSSRGGRSARPLQSAGEA